MKTEIFGLACFSLLLFGCASPGGFPPGTAEETKKIPADKRIELSLAPGTFAITEVEFHVESSALPKRILDRAKELVPGGYVGDCEIEYHDDKVFYEVTFTVKGEEQEIMFTAEGEPYRWEVEVRRADLPKEVLDAALAAVPDARLKKAEKILDGGKALLEYHIKLEKKWVKYKAAVSKEGELLGLWRETVGEIEVPLL
jgi:hypothetical protein